MADLAKLVVRLEAQSAQFLAELQKANSRLDKFERNATASLDKVNKRFEKFGFGVKSVLGAFLAKVSFGAVLTATDEAAANFANLENAVAKAGDAAGGRTAQEFANVARGISEITTESGGAVQGVQQLLLRFQSIRTDRFDEATKAALNLSVALKKDLQGSAELVGRALNDPVKGLTQLAKAGVTFSDAQEKVIKNLVATGRTAEAQGLILDKLEDRFGGAAEAARGSFSGALKGVRNALGDLLEANGGLPQATDSLNQLAKVLQDPAIRAAADSLFSVIIRGAAAAAQFIGEVVAGFTVLLGFGQDVAVNIDRQMEGLKQSLDAFKKTNPFPDEFGQEYIRKTTAELAKLTDQYNKLQGLGKAGVETARGGKAKGPDSLGEILPDIEVLGTASEAADKLRQKLEAQGKALTEKLQTPLEKYNAAVAEADALLSNNAITQETWARALGAARGELDTMGDAILEVSDRYKDFEQIIAEGGDENAKAILDEYATEQAKVFDDLGKQIEEGEKKVGVFAEEAARNTQDIIAGGLKSALDDGLDEGIDGALKAFGQMLEDMALQAIAADIAGKIFGEDGKGGGLLDKLTTWGKNIFGGGGKASSTASGGGDALEGILGGLFGGGFGGWFDNGGHVDAGVPVGIGRGAQPELFVPDVPGEMYPAGTWGKGSGSGVTQNIYTSSPITQRTARQLEMEAARAQRTTTARLG